MFNKKIKQDIEKLKKEVFGGADQTEYILFVRKPLKERIENIEGELHALMDYLNVYTHHFENKYEINKIKKIK